MNNKRAESLWSQSQKIMRYIGIVLNDLQEIEKLSGAILKRKLVMPSTRKNVQAISALAVKHTSIRMETAKNLTL